MAVAVAAAPPTAGMAVFKYAPVAAVLMLTPTPRRAGGAEVRLVDLQCCVTLAGTPEVVKARLPSSRFLPWNVVVGAMRVDGVQGRVDHAAGWRRSGWRSSCRCWPTG